jgi:hypothetical protein
METGTKDQLRPNYNLTWTFSGSSTTANPSGVIAIPATKSVQASLTLSQGTMTLTGTSSTGSRIHAVGTLVVRITGTSAAPTLEFTETGLRSAERALGLVSPFDANGAPLTLPMKTVKIMVGC